MNIYHLYRTDDFDYDEYDGKVIVAKSSQRARKMANCNVGYEGPIWNNPKKVKCKVVSVKKEQIILESFNAG